MNYNNSNLSNYINNETNKDAPKQNNNNNIINNVTEEKQITEEKEDKEDKGENIQNKEKESKESKEIPTSNFPVKIIKEDIKVKKIENQEILNDNNQNQNQNNENININQKKEEMPNLINKPSNKDINSINNINNNISSSEKKHQDTIIVQKVEKTNNKNTEIISKLFQRIIILRKKVSELMSKSDDNMLIRIINTNKQNINDNSYHIKKMKELTEKLDKEVKNLKRKNARL